LLLRDQAREAQRVFEKLAESFHVHVPTRADYVRAAACLGEYGLGLRAGAALHLAIAYNEALKQCIRSVGCLSLPGAN